MSETILIIDDDTSILEVSKVRFGSAGYSVLTAENGEKGIELLDQNRIDMVVLDVKMPGMGGKKALKEIQSKWPGLPVIILTAYGSIPDAVEAVRSGAVDYVTKPYDGLELVTKVKDYLNQGRGKMTSSPQNMISERIWGGESQRMKKLFDLISRVAPTDADVLITGESGTGKELVASMLHDMSPRAQGPYTVVDCSTTSATLLESELFGHKKGAFTNAYNDRKGLIQEAHQGTLFLDEIGNISLEMQSKLLRFLQERTIRRIGESREMKIDCRVVAATNADIADMIQKGSFREDLYFRIKGFNLHVPPLRERTEDIPLLAQKFLALFCKEEGKVNSTSLAPETMQCLLNYSWPGNVRELQQVLKTGMILCRDNVIRPEDLQLEESPKEEQQTNGLSLENSERQTILRALEQSGWVQKKAADMLGISRRAMHYKVKRLGISIPKRKKQ